MSLIAYWTGYDRNGLEELKEESKTRKTRLQFLIERPCRAVPMQWKSTDVSRMIFQGLQVHTPLSLSLSASPLTLICYCLFLFIHQKSTRYIAYSILQKQCFGRLGEGGNSPCQPTWLFVSRSSFMRSSALPPKLLHIHTHFNIPDSRSGGDETTSECKWHLVSRIGLI